MCIIYVYNIVYIYILCICVHHILLCLGPAAPCFALRVSGSYPGLYVQELG